MLAKVGDELLAISGAGGRAAEASQAQGERRDLEASEQIVEEHDQLGVHQRRVRTDRLGVELRELAKPPGLRSLVTKQRPLPPELHRLGELLHAVLEVGARDRRGRLGPQGDAAPALVLEGEHLLPHDVR